MYINAIMDVFRSWFSQDNLSSTFGYLIAIACGIFALTELYSIVAQKNEPDLFMMLFAGVLGGLIQGYTKDPLLAILFALCWLMIYSLWTIRESPVWRELMLSSLISYIVVLVGRIVQRAMEMRVAARGYDIETYVRWGLTGQQWFGISWNVFIYVFIALCLIFFGRRFFLVSRLTSPQVIYMLLFAFSYFILYRFAGEDGLNFTYPGVSEALGDKLLFASFGTYEIMIVTNILLYLISGPLLQFIFGVEVIKTDMPVKLIDRISKRIIKTEDPDLISKYTKFKKSVQEEKTDTVLVKELSQMIDYIDVKNQKRLSKKLLKLKTKIADREEHKRVLELVEEAKQKFGIKGKILVGKVKAPILNAFAYGAFFDKRIAFMSKDIRDFSDDDIRGIAGHELAHASRVHTLWLMVISAITFAITKAIEFPATPLDYIFDPNVGLEFLWYYLYNIAIVAFSYIFIRFLEGRADRMTMDAGYGKPLAKSLIKLDGFYQGIASEMGLSVYLLTNKEQTSAEKLRFLGDSGRNMYRNYVKPSISENFINLIASHPKSAYRVVALTEQDTLPPFKAAILPFLLVIPGIRKRYVKQLQEMRSSVTPIIDETFKNQNPKNGIQRYDKLIHLSYQYKYLIDKDIVAISIIDKKKFKLGKVLDVVLTDSITSPVQLKCTTADGEENIPINDYEIYELAIEQRQIFKNGQIGIITEIDTNEKRFAFKAKIIDNGEEIEKEFKVPGVPISYFQRVLGESIIISQKGVTRLASLEKIELSKVSLSRCRFTLKIEDEEVVIPGDKIIIAFKPFDVYIKKGKEEEQESLINYLNGKPVSFQTKDDLDTLLKGYVTSIDEETIKLDILGETKEVKRDRLEFLYIYEDSIAVIYKPSLSFIERLLMRLQNRRKLAYIIS